MLNNTYKACLMIFIILITNFSCNAEEFSYPQQKPLPIPVYKTDTQNSSCSTYYGIDTKINSYHTPKSYQEYNRSYYALLSSTDFQRIFQNISDTNQILNQYPLYAFENFLIFARTLPNYETHILSLNNKIKQNKNFKKQTAYMPYFDYRFV